MVRSYPMWGIGAGLFERKYSGYRAREDLFVYARAHNVVLRIAAECGLVTLALLLICTLWAGHALLARRASSGCDDEAAWQALRRTLCALAAILLATSLFSDIWLENTESVMLLSGLCAMSVVICRHLAPSATGADDDIDWVEPETWWQRAHASAHEKLMLLTWGHLNDISIRRTVVLLAITALCLVGMRRAFYEGRKHTLRGNAMHGFKSASAQMQNQGEWYAFGASAMRSVIVPGTVLCLTVRPLNDRMAQAAPHVTVYINNQPAGSISLHPGAPDTLYCDVSALQGDLAVIRLVADRTFAPWRLAWFRDPFAYGGLCRPLQWLYQEPRDAFTRLDGLWNARWTAHAADYLTLGHTNLNATVRVPWRSAGLP